MLFVLLEHLSKDDPSDETCRHIRRASESGGNVGKTQRHLVANLFGAGDSYKLSAIFFGGHISTTAHHSTHFQCDVGHPGLRHSDPRGDAGKMV